MSRSDNIRRAKEVIDSRRANSISTFEKHTAEVTSSVEGYREIDQALSIVGSRIMGTVLAGSKSSQTLDQIRKEYEDLAEAKKALLTNHGYPEDYCDIHYSCPACSDTGYVGVNICSCLKREIVRAFSEDSGLYSLLKNHSFETFSLDYYKGNDRQLMEQNLSILNDFADHFDAGESDSFLFYGGTGLGKTHLSSAVAKKLIENGSYVVYESAINMFSDYESARFGAKSAGSSQPDLEKYDDCDLLIIDDLGCEVTNQFTLSCLYRLIDSRIMKHKSTIISTNLNQDEIRKRYTDRLASRIFGEYRILIFLGTDIRQQKISNQ